MIKIHLISESYIPNTHGSHSFWEKKSRLSLSCQSNLSAVYISLKLWLYISLKSSCKTLQYEHLQYFNLSSCPIIQLFIYKFISESFFCRSKKSGLPNVLDIFIYLFKRFRHLYLNLNRHYMLDAISKYSSNFTSYWKQIIILNNKIKIQNWIKHLKAVVHLKGKFCHHLLTF